MSRRKRRTFSPEFKAKVVKEALKERESLSQLASKFELSTPQISAWKKQALEALPDAFSGSSKAAQESQDELVAKLYEEIGRLKMEQDWLKKNSGLSVNQKTAMIDHNHLSLSVRAQCRLPELSRSSLYYKPRPVCAHQLRLMRRIDHLYTAHPHLGSRAMRDHLRLEGVHVNRKRVQRLMRLMGLGSVAPRPGTSKPAPEHVVYPYLLRGVKIEHVGRVWSTDITSIPMGRSYLYLVAVMDWYSRYVLSWELSNSWEVDFCLSALKQALQSGAPQVFNTDQGA